MFDPILEKTIAQIYREAHAQRHEYLTVEHLLLGLLDNPVAQIIFQDVGVDTELLANETRFAIEQQVQTLPADSDQKPQTTLAFQRVMQRAIYSAQAAEKEPVSTERVVVSLFEEKDSYAYYLLTKQGVTRLDIVSYISHAMLDMDAADQPAAGGKDKTAASGDKAEGGEDKKRSGRKSRRDSEDSPESFLENLNEKAIAGEVDPLIGRDAELERMVQILLRRSKNNPLLVGEPGVGKTALAAGLAKRIVEGEVPDLMKKSVVYSLELGTLLAGTKYRGDFEKRMKKIIAHIKKLPDAILFIDEIHTLIGAGAVSGGALDASNMLKPALSSGKIRCIGATTSQEARSIFDKDRALSRRFQKIDVAEPSAEETVKILQGLKPQFEKHHGVEFLDEALEEAVKLTSRYMNDRFLPDKAIDAIDEAGAWQRMHAREAQAIDRSAIRKVVASMAKIPVDDLNSDDKTRLQRIAENLKLVIFGQDEAIDSLSTAIKLSRAGMARQDKPIASLLFAGPTGVGKTEVVKQLSAQMGLKLLRFDMSEYMEPHAVSRLIGAPPGYVGHEQGGLLTDQVHQNPHAIVLLDEIEKAHPDIFNVLLQIMDRGTLTDSLGREADFRNVLLVMTTNAGAVEQSRGSYGFTEQDHSSDAMQAIKRLFSPEFRNRLDAIIQFGHLSPEHVALIVDKLMLELEQDLADQGIRFQLTPAACQWLVEHGYDEAMGARPMQRAITDHIKKPLVDDMLFGRLEQGGLVRVDVQGDQLAFDIQPVAQAAGSEPVLPE